jgi:hypothetical protein
MSKFVTGKELASVVYNILFEAKEKLVLVSPYIKLDAYFRQILDQHAHNPQLELLVVFGKNPGHVTRSISREDLDYFTKFPHVTLVYAPTLHAKYYANETKGVVTSINLYDYSFEHNIEFGVYSERPQLVEKLLLESLHSKSVDDQAFMQALQVASTHDVVFARRPCFKLQKGFIAKFTKSKDYLEPAILCNALEELVHNRSYPARRLSEFPAEVEFSQTLAQTLPPRPEVALAPSAATWGTTATATPTEPRHKAVYLHAVSEVAARQGYCIRTGEPIPFNPERPFCYAAYKSWASFGNEEYPERYCHQTGKPSHGRTSKRQPIL